MIGNTVNADQFIGGEGSMMIRGGNTVHADHWQFIGGEGSMLWMAGREVMLSSKARRHWQAGLHQAPQADFSLCPLPPIPALQLQADPLPPLPPLAPCAVVLLNADTIGAGWHCSGNTPPATFQGKTTTNCPA